MAIRIDLKGIREERGISQEQIARELDCSTLTYRNIENGRTSKIDLEKLDKICKVLNVEPKDVIKQDK